MQRVTGIYSLRINVTIHTAFRETEKCCGKERNRKYDIRQEWVKMRSEKNIKKNEVYHRGENRNSRIHQGKINSRFSHTNLNDMRSRNEK